MKYDDGTVARVGDRVCIRNGDTGVVIASMDCRFSEPLDPASAEILKTFPPVGVRISQNLSPL